MKNWLSRIFGGNLKAIPPSGQLKDHLKSRALKLRGPGEGPPLIHPLLEAIHDSSPRVRVAAATDLGGISQPWATSALVEQLEDGCRDVREAAAKSLGRIGDSCAKADLMGLLIDPDVRVRLAASEVLSQLHDSRWKELILGEEADLSRLTKSEIGSELLATVARDCGVRSRKQALVVLAQLGTPFAITLLTEAVADPDETIRDEAIEALAKIGGRAVFESLTEAVKDDRRDFRRANAAIALGRIGFQEAWNDLLLSADAQAKIVQEAAQEALMRLMRAHASCFSHAVALIQQAEDPSQRLLACKLLAMMNDRRAIPPLIHALTDDESDMRRAATGALRSLGSHLTEDPLLQALWDKTNPARRVAVIGLLQDINSRKVATAIVEAAEDESSPVREAALAAVARLGLRKCQEEVDVEMSCSAPGDPLGNAGKAPQDEKDRAREPCVGLKEETPVGKTPSGAARPETSLACSDDLKLSHRKHHQNLPPPPPAAKAETPPVVPARRCGVFISAFHKDYPLASEFYDFLSQNGITAFFSERSLSQLGQSDYRRAIDQALDEARHMFVVTSHPEHVRSRWVEAEWGLFINELRSGNKTGNLVILAASGVQPRLLPASLRYYTVLPFGHEGFCKALAYLRSEEGCRSIPYELPPKSDEDAT